MAVMEVVLRTTIDQQEQVNRWNYISSGTPASVSLSFALISAMGFIPSLLVFPDGTIMDWLIEQLSNNVTFDEVQARDIYSTTDFYTTPFPAGTVGLGGDQSLPPFNAYGFRTNRVRSDIARGTKRFSGVQEGVVGDGGLITSAGLTLLNDMADRMSETLTYDDEGNTLTFVPAVLKREPYTTPSGRTAYRYFSTAVAQLANAAQGIAWEPYNTVRSQVSRQYGRGA